MVCNEDSIDHETAETIATSENTSSIKKGTFVAIVVLSLLAKALPIGPMKSISIYFLSFQENLNASTREAASVRSIMFGLRHICAPLSTVMCNLLGYRKTMVIGASLASIGMAASSCVNSIHILYITLGVCGGIGASLINTPTSALIGQVFTTKRHLANNLALVGSSVIAAPLTFVVQYWIDMYSWRGSILLLSCVVMQSIPVVLLLTFQAKKTHVEIKPKGNRKLFNFHLLRNKYFILYCLSGAAQSGGATLLNTYLIRYAQYLGINDYKAVSLATAMYIIEMICRPTSGFILTQSKIGRFSVNRMKVYIVLVLYQTCTTLSFSFVHSYNTLFVCTIAYSVGNGSIGGLAHTVLAEQFGPKNLLDSLGIRSVLIGSVVMTMPPLVGILIDYTGNYAVIFYASSCLGLLASVLLMVVEIKHKPEE